MERYCRNRQRRDLSAVYPLNGNAQIWQSVEEICFTVFIEDEYIQGTKGFFEIMDCVLEK